MSDSSAERVLNLLIALINTRSGMSKAQIRDRVQGYRGNDAAFERTFERDKELLRSLGVQIRTTADPLDETDIRYSVDTGAGPAITATFTPQQLGIMAVAATLYDDAAWGSLTQSAATKVRGLGDIADPGLIPPLRIRTAPPSDVLDVVLGAIDERRRIEFDYPAHHAGVERRRIEPWKIHARGSAWYVTGLDQDREAQRTFRLNRIHGHVTPVGDSGAFDIPTVTSQTLSDETTTIRLAVIPGRGELLRSRGRLVDSVQLGDETRSIIELDAVVDAHLIEELASYGPDVVVMSPGHVRDAILDSVRHAAEVSNAS